MSDEPAEKLPEGFGIILARLDSFERNLTARMDSFEQNVTTRIDGFESRLGEIEGNVTASMDSFEQRLTALEDKVDERLQEIRPVWEAVQAQVAELKDEMEKGFRNVERRLDVVSADINQMRADLRHLENRVDKLERPHQ